jgi:hypothetical protein
MRLLERKFDDLSPLRYRVQTTEVNPNFDVLVISFSGAYRLGSGGDGDAAFMLAIAKAALWAWRSFGLVLDLRELEYTSGDKLGAVLSCGEDQWVDAEFPVRVVVSDRCREGITSLVEDELFLDASTWISPSVEQALSSISASLKDSSAQGLIPGWEE